MCQFDWCAIAWGDVATWFGSIITTVGLLYALYRETWLAFRNRPKLEVRIDERVTEDCTDSTESRAFYGRFYVRMWIRNTGRSHAEHLIVFADELRRGGSKVAGFIPMRLLWTHTSATFAEGIFSGMGAHCDFGWLEEIGRLRPLPPDAVLSNGVCGFILSTEKQPPNNPTVLRPGDYELDLTVAARNSRAHQCTVAIHVPNAWDTRAELRVRGGKVRELK